MDEFLEKNGYSLTVAGVPLRSRREEIWKEMISLGFHADDLLDVFSRRTRHNSWFVFLKVGGLRGVAFMEKDGHWTYLGAFDGMEVAKFQEMNGLFELYKERRGWELVL